MTGLIFILIGILIPVAFIVLLPLFETEANRPANHAGELREQQAQLRASLGDIEFDHAMNQIGDEDYEQLRQELGNEAETIARQLNQADES